MRGTNKGCPCATPNDRTEDTGELWEGGGCEGRGKGEGGEDSCMVWFVVVKISRGVCGG